MKLSKIIVKNLHEKNFNNLPYATRQILLDHDIKIGEIDYGFEFHCFEKNHKCVDVQVGLKFNSKQLFYTIPNKPVIREMLEKHNISQKNYRREVYKLTKQSLPSQPLTVRQKFESLPLECNFCKNIIFDLSEMTDFCREYIRGGILAIDNLFVNKFMLKKFVKSNGDILFKIR